MHGERITVKAIFELLPVRRPILSVSRLIDKRFAVVMGNDQGNKLSKNGRETHLHKANGVYHVRASELSKLLYPLEDQDPWNDAGPQVEAVGEENLPWTPRLPYEPTDAERLSHSVSHLPFREWCSHCVKGLARDWPHRSDYRPPPDIPTVAMDEVLTNLAVREKPFQSVGATVLPDKSASEVAVATIIRYLDFWGHKEVMIKCDQEHSMKRRRTIVEYNPKVSHQCNGVVRRMRSDLMEKTGVNVHVKS